MSKLNLPNMYQVLAAAHPLLGFVIVDGPLWASQQAHIFQHRFDLMLSAIQVVNSDAQLEIAISDLPTLAQDLFEFANTIIQTTSVPDSADIKECAANLIKVLQELQILE